MKHFFNIKSITLIGLMFFSTIFSQTYPPVSVDLTIDNQTVVGTDFFFDIYITRTGTNDCYLANADFVFSYNHTNFTSPVLSSEGSSPGFCTFVPTTRSTSNDLFTQDLYFGSTSTNIISNYLIINLNGPAPGAQSYFDTRIARIDNVASTYRLGRFKISGISNTSGSAGLKWRTASPHPTFVYTFENSFPNYTQYLVTINAIDPTDDPPLPVELNSFTAKLARKSVELNWSTVSEINNYGFDIQRRYASENKWSELGFVPGSGNSNSSKEYSFTDNNLDKNGKYIYRLKQLDSDGSFEFSSEVAVDVMNVTEYTLNQNYPNPFNPSTKIAYTIPQDGFVKINLFNSLGEKIETLVSEFQSTGAYTINYDGSKLNSGIYLYKIEVNDFSAIKKMMLLK